MNEPHARAPQLPSDPARWLNTGGKAVSLSDLNGCVVLLHFWDYSCLHCLRALPDIHYLQTKYADRPFVVIGIHTPETDNAKGHVNLRHALLRHEVHCPVVRDDDHRVRQAYEVHALPTFTVLDTDGFTVGSLAGEGRRDALSDNLGDLLRAAGSGREMRRPPVFTPEMSPAPDTLLHYPGKILADPLQERLFIADTAHNCLVICSLDGLRPQIIGSGEAGRADGKWQTARFHQPQGMALVGDSLFVCDSGNHLLRRVDLKQQTVATSAGTGGLSPPRQAGGAGLKTPLSSPADICYNQAEHGQLYLAMAGANQIWRYDLHTGNMLPFAGTGRESRIDGPAGSAAFAQPVGICVDGGSLYVVESENGSVRRVALDNPNRVASVETLAGGGLSEGNDGNGREVGAGLQHPMGVCCQAGHLYIADTFHQQIKVMEPKTGKMTACAGNGQAGLVNGAAEQAQFYEPRDVSAAGGKLYIADTNNKCIRVLNLETRIVTTLDIFIPRSLRITRFRRRIRRRKTARNFYLSFAEHSLARKRYITSACPPFHRKSIEF